MMPNNKNLKKDSMVKKYKYLSPFKTLISFHKLIKGLEEMAASDNGYKAEYSRDLLHQIKERPEFIDGIDDLDVIENNQELIKNLVSDLFPIALTHNEIKAITLPFHDFTFNYSERFKKIYACPFSYL
jgi:hypothetical protein